MARPRRAPSRPITNVLLCVEFHEDVMSRYRDIFGALDESGPALLGGSRIVCVRRRFEFTLPGGERVPYNVVLALGVDEATEIAGDLREAGEEVVVGVFELPGDGTGDETVRAVQQIRAVFAQLTCAIIAPYTQTLVERLGGLFDAPDEWLYFDRPGVSWSELEHTIANLIATFEGRRRLETALETVAAGRREMRGILDHSPELLKIQSTDALHRTIVSQAAEMLGARDALLLVDGQEEQLAPAAGLGRLKDPGMVLLSKLEPLLKRVLEAGTPVAAGQATVVPLVLHGKRLGALYLGGGGTPPQAEILELFASQSAFALENHRLRLELEARQALEQELKVAAQIQQHLVPSSFPELPGLSLFGMMRSARQIGGDYFDCIERTENGETELVTAIGDVAGKGLAAGLIMSEVRSCIRSQVPLTRNIKLLLTRTAEQIQEDLRASQNKFLSLLIARWTPGSNKMRFSAGGHEHILHYRARKRRVKAHRTGGVVLGVPLDVFCDRMVARTLVYEPGDVIMFYTDGVTEAVDRQGRMLKLDRLVEMLEEAAELDAEKLVRTIYERVMTFTNGAEQRDDITLLAVKATANGAANQRRRRD